MHATNVIQNSSLLFYLHPINKVFFFYHGKYDKKVIQKQNMS